MRKIAGPQDLQAELQRLLAYSQGENPSRQVVARELRKLAVRVAPPDLPEVGAPIFGPRDSTPTIAKNILRDVSRGKLVRLSPKGSGRYHDYAIWAEGGHLEYITGGRWGIEPLGNNQGVVERILAEWIKDQR
jgi:hypothetical protein